MGLGAIRDLLEGVESRVHVEEVPDLEARAGGGGGGKEVEDAASFSTGGAAGNNTEKS
jgi:hypothetical protein